MFFARHHCAACYLRRYERVIKMKYFIIFFIWIPSAILVRYIAIKRGADSLAWTITGISLGPFALPFLILCKKKKDPLKSLDQ